MVSKQDQALDLARQVYLKYLPDFKAAQDPKTWEEVKDKAHDEAYEQAKTIMPEIQRGDITRGVFGSMRGHSVIPEAPKTSTQVTQVTPSKTEQATPSKNGEKAEKKKKLRRKKGHPLKLS